MPLDEGCAEEFNANVDRASIFRRRAVFNAACKPFTPLAVELTPDLV